MKRGLFVLSGVKQAILLQWFSLLVPFATNEKSSCCSSLLFLWPPASRYAHTAKNHDNKPLGLKCPYAIMFSKLIYPQSAMKSLVS